MKSHFGTHTNPRRPKKVSCYIVGNGFLLTKGEKLMSLPHPQTDNSQGPIDPASDMELTAQMEPFDSFWEGPEEPEEVEKGYGKFYQFYHHNYLKHLPADHNARILVISCGPGYFVNTLNKQGYKNVIGIDSFESKVKYGQQHNLDCRAERAFPFLASHKNTFNVIFCEQELNHLTKKEMLIFLRLARESLISGGTLIVHGLNGANPITGSEALAQNFDHYNTFTEYTLRQVLQHSEFKDIHVFPLHLYVFYKNPFNYVAWGASALLSLFFRVCFILYGKSNKLFTKKIAATCQKPK
ncbi:class I SAM-dependent methyltransferase [Nitrosococcus wardiae]|uniref:Methyltransferase domain-containing protein n=1 Tax=Nitrosococcus wardiae TaxID=1814290 RepID=A0A4P7BYZ3_9GAMM|nr:methyltransferase domain-containing protein [Nitrosococcus wardiae]QBQ54404.1 methyltransferase domain-containing protein [Nitrosococcus wardiae]